MDTPRPMPAQTGDGLPAQPPSFPTPEQIVKALDRTVFGQRAAKRALALAVYKHYLGVAQSSGEGQTPAFGQQHVLLVGPTGSGKSHLVRELARFLGVPVAFCPATRLVETGYVGEQVESVVRALLHVAGGDRARAARGIIVLDEIDKIRAVSTDTRDVSGRGVQNSLLTLLDGVRVPIQREDQSKTIDTSGMLFIATGAFVGLDEIARHRDGSPSRLGFGAVDGGAERTGEVLHEATTADFVDFGLIPELMGRLRHICRLEKLSSEQLVGLALEAENSALRRLQESFAAHGVRLEFSRKALQRIAERAFALDTGSRGLDRVLAEVVAEVEWRVMSDRLVGRRVTFDVDRHHDIRARIRKIDGAPSPSAPELRQRVASAVPPRPAATQQITDTRGWSDAAILAKVGALRPLLEIQAADLVARGWWMMVEREYQPRPALLLRLIEELAMRGMKLAEFHAAVGQSGTSNLQANLHFADYLRLKREEERGGKTG
ncbi:MAG: AAA family ATPase [Planctomycetota bacterium]